MSTFTEGLVLGDVSTIFTSTTLPSGPGINLYQCPVGRFAEMFISYVYVQNIGSGYSPFFGVIKANNGIPTTPTSDIARSILLVNTSADAIFSRTAFTAVTEFQSQILLDSGDYIFANNSYGASVPANVQFSAIVKEWIKP